MKMSDITKCNGDNCNLSENCYRFTAESNKYRQSYFYETPKVINNICELFIDNKEYTKIKKHD